MLEWVPDWIAIIGSGYIGLEFSDVYTALGSEVTFIEVWQTMAGISLSKAWPNMSIMLFHPQIVPS